MKPSQNKTSKISPSPAKYKKFKGMEHPGSKREVSIDSLSRASQSSIRSLNQNSLLASKKSLGVSPFYPKKNQHTSLSQISTNNRKKNLSQIMQLIHSLLKDFKDLINTINYETQKTIQNVVRQVRKQMFSFVNKKYGFQQSLQEFEDFIKKSQTTKSKFEIVRAQSLTTSEDRVDHVPIHHKNTSFFQNMFKVRDQIKKQAHGKSQKPGIGAKGDLQKQIKEYDKQQSLYSYKGERNRSRSRSVSKQIKNLQNKIGSIKNILQK